MTAAPAVTVQGSSSSSTPGCSRAGWLAGPAPEASSVCHRLLASAGQLSPGGVEVTLGALGPGAQLATRLLKHLGA
jgi:hypothetical protein